jgi:hypothetical protein
MAAPAPAVGRVVRHTVAARADTCTAFVSLPVSRPTMRAHARIARARPGTRGKSTHRERTGQNGDPSLPSHPRRTTPVVQCTRSSTWLLTEAPLSKSWSVRAGVQPVTSPGPAHGPRPHAPASSPSGGWLVAPPDDRCDVASRPTPLAAPRPGAAGRAGRAVAGGRGSRPVRSPRAGAARVPAQPACRRSPRAGARCRSARCRCSGAGAAGEEFDIGPRPRRSPVSVVTSRRRAA